MLILFLLALPILLLFLLLVLQAQYNNTQSPRPPPGPPGLPFIGNLHQIILNSAAPHSYLSQLAQKHGPLMSIRLGSVPTLVVSSAKMAKQVMKTHDLTFSSRPLLLGQKKLSYNGLDVAFSPYNDLWREKKKTSVLHLFSSKKVQSFRPIREEEASRMVKKISRLADSSKVVNLSEIMMSLTISLTCRVAFGKRYEEDEGIETSRFHGLLNEAQAMMGSFFVSDYFPLMGWVVDKVTGMCARLEKNFEGLDLFYEELIADHLNPKRLESMQGDILDILLQLRKDQSTPIDITLDHIKALLMDIFTGGTDTSAAAVVWVMTALMKNPKVMKKVQEEVRKLIGKKGKVDEDDVQKLPYLKSVIKEAMRLYPSIPLVPRQTIDKCIIDGYEIQSKNLVYINVWAIGRDPEAWKNPEEFLPERFMGCDTDFRGQDFGLIPFGAGRRGCPGINFGIATVELALTNLLYSFDWELPAGMKMEDIDTDVMPGVTMHKKNALCLMARK